MGYQKYKPIDDILRLRIKAFIYIEKVDIVYFNEIGLSISNSTIHHWQTKAKNIRQSTWKKLKPLVRRYQYIKETGGIKFKPQTVEEFYRAEKLTKCGKVKVHLIQNDEVAKILWKREREIMKQQMIDNFDELSESAQNKIMNAAANPDLYIITKKRPYMDDFLLLDGESRDLVKELLHEPDSFHLVKDMPFVKEASIKLWSRKLKQKSKGGK